MAAIFDHRERLGFTMDYTYYVDGVPGGVALHDSFWCVSGDIVFNPDEKRITYWYRCWRSIADYESGLPPVQGVSKVYQATPYSTPSYDEARMMLTQGGPIGLELLQMFNANAIATKDLLVEVAAPTEANPEATEIQYVSFFKDAQPA